MSGLTGLQAKNAFVNNLSYKTSDMQLQLAYYMRGLGAVGIIAHATGLIATGVSHNAHKALESYEWALSGPGALATGGSLLLITLVSHVAIDIRKKQLKEDFKSEFPDQTPIEIFKLVASDFWTLSDLETRKYYLENMSPQEAKDLWNLLDARECVELFSDSKKHKESFEAELEFIKAYELKKSDAILHLYDKILSSYFKGPQIDKALEVPVIIFAAYLIGQLPFIQIRDLINREDVTRVVDQGSIGKNATYQSGAFLRRENRQRFMRTIIAFRTCVYNNVEESNHEYAYFSFCNTIFRTSRGRDDITPLSEEIENLTDSLDGKFSEITPPPYFNHFLGLMKKTLHKLEDLEFSGQATRWATGYDKQKQNLEKLHQNPPQAPQD